MTSQIDEALEGKVRFIYLWSTLVCDVCSFSKQYSGNRSRIYTVQEDSNVDAGKPEDASVADVDKRDPGISDSGAAQAGHATPAEARSPEVDDLSEFVPAAHSGDAEAPEQTMVEDSGQLNGATDQPTVEDTANQKVRS